MSFFQRLRYALYLTAVVGAFIGFLIALASSDVIGLLPKSAFGLLMSPVYGLVIFVAAFLLAPLFSSHFQITGWEDASPDQRNNNKNHFAIRQMFIVLVGLVLILVANLLVYFISGKS